MRRSQSKFEPRVEVLTDNQIWGMSGPTESELGELLGPTRRTFLRKSVAAPGAGMLMAGKKANAADSSLRELFPAGIRRPCFLVT